VLLEEEVAVGRTPSPLQGVFEMKGQAVLFVS